MFKDFIYLTDFIFSDAKMHREVLFYNQKMFQVRFWQSLELSAHINHTTTSPASEHAGPACPCAPWTGRTARPQRGTRGSHRSLHLVQNSIPGRKRRDSSELAETCASEKKENLIQVIFPILGDFRHRGT